MHSALGAQTFLLFHYPLREISTLLTESASYFLPVKRTEFCGHIKLYNTRQGGRVDLMNATIVCVCVSVCLHVCLSACLCVCMVARLS